MVDVPRVQTGDQAFAWNVQNLADVFQGQYPLNVRFTRWSHATTPSLLLANRTAGGPILELVEEDLVTRVMIADKTGWRSMKVNGFIDFKYQSEPDAPGAGTQTIRMYSRAGQLWFKVENSIEQQIPVGAPPGPTVRYAFWMTG